MTDKESFTTGGCLCDAVRYEVKGQLRDVVNCHCSMCQRSLARELRAAFEST